MNKTALRITAGVALLALGACSKEEKTPIRAAQEPDAIQKVFKRELMTDPLEKDPKANVFALTAKAADFPELKVTTLKEGEGEATLEMGKIGVFHLVGKLSSGREFKNTKTSGAPQDVIMMEWGDIQGLILGTVGMKVGEVRSLRVPPDLAYGEKGSPMDRVPGHATLFLRAELTEIKDDLPEGFLVRRMQAGKGAPIRVGQRGKFNYTGVLAEGDRAGEQFDSSLEPGREPFPMTVGVSGAIEGWLKGGIGMRVGEKRWLKIPSKFAYGDSGQGSIPPGATLIFEMELVGIDG